MMELTYYKKWFIREKKAINELSYEEAKEKHLKKEPYTVLVKDDNIIKYIIDIASRFILVNFMNDRLRPYLIYEFHVKENNKIFLKMASYYEYNEDEERTESILFNFSENGKIAMERRNLTNQEMEERDLDYSVDCNWDEFPDFGNYERLLNEERYS